MANHEYFMRAALAQARKALGHTRPNPLVGAIITRGTKIIARGFHKKAGTDHAEIVAIKKAGSATRGATLYVTLEPCNNTGRTGPCTESIIAAGIRRVVVASGDPNPLVNGSGIARLRRAGVEVLTGVEDSAARELNETYNYFISRKRPFVVAKIAQSLDGRVATRTGSSQWITNEAARNAGHRLRNIYDAVLVGIGTILVDDAQLTCRVRGGRDPVRVVADTHARTPTTAKVVCASRSSSAPTWIVTGTQAPARRCRALEKAGAHILQCKARNGHLDPQSLLDLLGRHEIVSVLLEGGPTLLGAFSDLQLVQKWEIFVAPLLVGGVRAKASIGGDGVDTIDNAQTLRITSCIPLDANFHITAYPA